MLETDDKTGLSFVSFKEDLFLLYYALKYYTDLPEDADPVEVYDYMMSTGLWKQIYNEIQSDYCCT